MKTKIASFFCLVMLGAPRAYPAKTYTTDGSAPDIREKIAAASHGDTITIPSGTFVWTSPVSITKAVKLTGGGSGRIIANSLSKVTVGTGEKTFTTTKSGLPLSAGQVLRVAKMPHSPGSRNESTPPARGTYMEGTVISYSGTTLVMNVTATAGSGTWEFWWIATAPTTTIIHNFDNGTTSQSATPLIQITQNQIGSAEIAGIKFVGDGGSGHTTLIGISADAFTGPKTLIHDCWFQSANSGVVIHSESNRGLVWNCSFDDTFSKAAGGITVKWEDALGRLSWTTPSTMGTADKNGATNFYVEDCDFHAHLGIFDVESAARMVIRHCLFDNSGMSSHGADTGGVGLRHVELYDNELVFNVFGGGANADTLPLEWFCWIRGGTGVVTDNYLPAISSSAWGNKANIYLSALNIRRNSGGFPCWTSYPAPHQVGQGYGPGAEFHSYSGSAPWFETGYNIYSEPLYIWGNSGSGGNNVSLNGEGDDPCGNNQQVTDYIQAGRDYKIEPKPGYTKYVYPHPGRATASPIPPANLRIIPSPTP